MRFIVVGSVIKRAERMPGHTHEYRPYVNDWGIPVGEVCACGARGSTDTGTPNVSRET